MSIGVAPSTPSEGRLERLSTPNARGDVLRGGSDCIVALVTVAPVDIVVTVFLENKRDPVPSLLLDKVGLDETPSVTAAPTAATASTATAAAPAGQSARVAPKRTRQVPSNGVSLIGHIEGVGDVIALPGMTLGDARSDLRLEGFQLVWPDRPDGVDLEYGVTVEGAGPLPLVKTGQFSGTRGAGCRAVEVKFALVGAQAQMFELQGKASFSGGFDVPLRSGVPHAGPSGMEHLTSLSIEVVPRVLVRRRQLEQDQRRPLIFDVPQDAAENQRL